MLDYLGYVIIKMLAILAILLVAVKSSCPQTGASTQNQLNLQFCASQQVYLVSSYVGTPKQQLNLLLDINNSPSLIGVKGLCQTGCMTKSFDYTISTSFNVGSDQSWTSSGNEPSLYASIFGPEGSDVISLPPAMNTSLIQTIWWIQNGTYTNSSLTTPYDGILGLGPSGNVVQAAFNNPYAIQLLPGGFASYLYVNQLPSNMSFQNMQSINFDGQWIVVALGLYAEGNSLNIVDSMNYDVLYITFSSYLPYIYFQNNFYSYIVSTYFPKCKNATAGYLQCTTKCSDMFLPTFRWDMKSGPSVFLNSSQYSQNASGGCSILFSSINGDGAMVWGLPFMYSYTVSFTPGSIGFAGNTLTLFYVGEASTTFFANCQDFIALPVTVILGLGSIVFMFQLMKSHVGDSPRS